MTALVILAQVLRIAVPYLFAAAGGVLSERAGIVIAALLFATLSQGGLAVNAVVPKQLMDVLQAVVILAVAIAVPEVRRVLRAAGGRAA